RRPPRSPLFRYTTLFRSDEPPERARSGLAVLRAAREHLRVTRRPKRRARLARETYGKRGRIAAALRSGSCARSRWFQKAHRHARSEEHTSELQSLAYRVC